MDKIGQKQLDILYECWKESENYKESIPLVERRLPKISTILALKLMRQMAKTDPKWIKWSTRQKNKLQKEKDEIEKKSREEKEKREFLKAERAKKREARKKIRKESEDKEVIKDNIDKVDRKYLEGKVKNKFVFCKYVGQQINTVSCINRVFGSNEDLISYGPCHKCKKMDKHIPVLKEIIKDV